MKFKLIEYVLNEGKNLDKTWEQYKDKIISKVTKDNPQLFKDISDMPFVSDGDGYDEVTDKDEIERRAKGAWISLISTDPTMPKENNPKTTGDYGIWLTNRYLDGQISWYNSDLLSKTLQDFTKKKISLQKKDINQYKSVNELVSAVDSVDFTARQKERMLRNAYGDSKLLYKDDHWAVYQVTSYASACTLGKGTRWCTAYSDNSDYYDSYSKDGNLYVIINLDDTTDKYQLFVPENNAENHFAVEMHDKNDGDMHGHQNWKLDVDEFLNLDKVTDGLRDFLINKADIHRHLEMPDNADVLAVMEVTGQTADSAREDLENGDTWVELGIFDDIELGRHEMENYAYAFDESLEHFVDWEKFGTFIIDDKFEGDTQEAFDYYDIKDTEITEEDDLVQTDKMDKAVPVRCLEELGKEYFDIDHDVTVLEPYFDFAEFGYSLRQWHNGTYSNYGLVMFN